MDHPASQKGVFLPLPMCISVELKNRTLSVDPAP
jgi:hypothetical protein